MSGLKLYSMAAEDDQQPQPEPRKKKPGPKPRAELSSQMTMRQFFEAWYLPVVLAPQSASAGTLLVYLDALTWWEKTTGNPPIWQIDEYTLAAYTQGLREQTYKRSDIKEERKLSESSIAKHMRTMRALLHRIGPNVDPTRPSKELTKERLGFKIQKQTSGLKSTFTLNEARKVVEAAALMEHPHVPNRKPSDWWRAFLSALYVTGLRIGTVRMLEWSMLEQVDGVWWLNVPARIVPKTHKPKLLALPTWMAETLHQLPRTGRCIFQYTRHKDTLGNDHKTLMRHAGLPASRRFELKAWRRLHCTEMQRLGLGFAQNIGRLALDHSDVETTTSHYANLENEVRLKLPCLWGEEQQQDDRAKLEAEVAMLRQERAQLLSELQAAREQTPAQPIDPTRERLVALANAWKVLLPKRSQGKFYEYAERGLNGIRLQTVLIDNKLHTSHEAWERFLATVGTSPLQQARVRQQNRPLDPDRN